ncbi:MAG: hypothetical protein PHW78_05620 [Macromonas bipunctata]|nr:hypothetical protein [Macromonas bipunctata]
MTMSYGLKLLCALTSAACLATSAMAATSSSSSSRSKASVSKSAKAKVKASSRSKAVKVAKLGAVGAAGVAGGAALASMSSRPAAPLTDAEQAIAANVHVGELPCELGQKVSLRADPNAPGYFHMSLKGERFHMRPVQSSTGAVRLEDTAQGAVWIQLANKSMLMSQKQGRRLADECASPEQQAAAVALKANPINLLDGPAAGSPRSN